MTVSATLSARAAMLDGFDTFMGTGSGTATATLYQTNTALAVFNLDNTPFGAAVLDSLPLASTPISSTGTEVAGTATRLVLANRDGTQALVLTVGGIGSGAAIETPSLTVTAAATQTLSSLVLRAGSDGKIFAEGSLTLQ